MNEIAGVPIPTVGWTGLALALAVFAVGFLGLFVAVAVVTWRSEKKFPFEGLLLGAFGFLLVGGLANSATESIDTDALAVGLEEHYDVTLRDAGVLADFPEDYPVTVDVEIGDGTYREVVVDIEDGRAHMLDGIERIEFGS